MDRPFNCTAKQLPVLTRLCCGTQTQQESWICTFLLLPKFCSRCRGWLSL